MKKFILIAFIPFLLSGCCSEDKCREKYPCPECPPVTCNIPQAVLNASGNPQGFKAIDQATADAYVNAYDPVVDKVEGLRLSNNALTFILCNKNSSEVYLNLGKDGDRVVSVYYYKISPTTFEYIVEEPDTNPQPPCPPNCIPPRPGG